MTGRSNQEHRNAQILKSAGAGTIARIISVGTSIITVPLTLHYLGSERYGMWMTISSLLALLSFGDLGIGNGLLSSIASASGNDNRFAIRAKISSAYVAVSLLALALLFIFTLTFRYIDWSALFNVTALQARNEAPTAVAALFICFAVAIPLGMIQRVQMGLQQTYLANLWQCGSSIVTLAAVYLAIKQEVTLTGLVLTVAGVPLIVLALNSLVFFKQAPDLRPSFALFSIIEAREIGRIGGLFLVLQIVSALIYSTDNVIIAHLLGPDAVSEYTVPQKLFSVINVALTVVLAPLWPAYGEAIARGDRTWVRKALERSLLLSIAFSCATSIALVFTAPVIIQWWVGKAVVPSTMLLVSFGVWKVIEAIGSALSMFLNGANIVGFQILISTATAFIALILKILLIYEMGISGVLWATSLAYLACVILPIIFIRKKIFFAVSPTA